jgi:4-diphosphocytidyl-2-C-methyl-D-erythritol kinase
VICYPNAKINIGLNIVNKRNDGFHDIESIFLPISLCDILEVIEYDVYRTSSSCSKLPTTNLEIVTENLNNQIIYSSSGLAISNNLNNNLCIKAYKLLQKDFANLPPIKMHLHKIIPMGAGLGGGSANASFVLQLINEIANLQLTQNRLLHYALELGSDCPFFIINKPCFATSRGEVLEPVSIDILGYKILIVNPKIHIATPWAFSKISPKKPNICVAKAIEEPIENWKHLLVNDFETVVANTHVEINNIKEFMYKSGAIYASMTGTGSTVFGIFKEEVAINFPEKYLTKWVDAL